MKHEAFANEVKEQISQILWEQWDPIGVNDEPQARNEYDGYVSHIFVLLSNGADDVKIAAHFCQLETGSMGLRGSTDTHLERVIAALREIDLNTNAL